MKEIKKNNIYVNLAVNLVKQEIENNNGIVEPMKIHCGYYHQQPRITFPDEYWDGKLKLEFESVIEDRLNELYSEFDNDCMVQFKDCGTFGVRLNIGIY